MGSIARFLLFVAVVLGCIIALGYVGAWASDRMRIERESREQCPETYERHALCVIVRPVADNNQEY